MAYIFILFFLQTTFIFSNNSVPSFEGLAETSNVSKSNKISTIEINKNEVEYVEIDQFQLLKNKVNYYINHYYPRKYQTIFKISLGDSVKFETAIDTISSI